MGVIADRGLRRAQWTSARLMKEVLFLETTSERFEVSRESGPEPGEPGADKYRLAKCRVRTINQIRRAGLPTHGDDLMEVVANGVLWEELQWSAFGLTFRNRQIAVVRLRFMAIDPADDVEKEEEKEEEEEEVVVEGKAAAGAEEERARGEEEQEGNREGEEQKA